jgi:hypothetical protein
MRYEWVLASEMLPPREWVLICQVFDQTQYPGQRPMINIAYYEERDGRWRSRSGPLSGMETNDANIRLAQENAELKARLKALGESV